MSVNGQNTRVFFATTEEECDGNEQDENLTYQDQAGAKHISLFLFTYINPNENLDRTNAVDRYVLGHTDPNAQQQFRQGGNMLDTVFYTTLMLANK